MMKLIELWSEYSIQAQLEGSKRNVIVFNKIARDMEAAGFGNPLTRFCILICAKLLYTRNK